MVFLFMKIFYHIVTDMVICYATAPKYTLHY
jgi:hypothetical protein